MWNNFAVMFKTSISLFFFVWGWIEITLEDWNVDWIPKNFNTVEKMSILLSCFDRKSETYEEKFTSFCEFVGHTTVVAVFVKEIVRQKMKGKNIILLCLILTIFLKQILLNVQKDFFLKCFLHQSYRDSLATVFLCLGKSLVKLNFVEYLAECWMLTQMVNFAIWWIVVELYKFLSN